jgi:hypothetical protein
VAEKARVQAQQVLLESRELRQPEREPAVVAEIPEIAEVVGDALALEQECPQPRAATRHAGAGGALERHRVGPSIGDRAVARDPAGEACALGQAHRFEAPLDALVDVSEALLEAKHAFSHYREAEMSRLDDARVDRSDGDFVHAIAFDLHERIRSIAVDQPGPFVLTRAKAVQITDRTLHPRGGGEEGREVRVGQVGQREIEAEQPLVHHAQGMDRGGPIARPQRSEPASVLPYGKVKRNPVGRIDRVPFDEDAHPISCAARRYQSTRYAGM